jgi:hypothetical protein
MLSRSITAPSSKRWPSSSTWTAPSSEQREPGEAPAERRPRGQLPPSSAGSSGPAPSSGRSDRRAGTRSLDALGQRQGRSAQAPERPAVIEPRANFDAFCPGKMRVSAYHSAAAMPAEQRRGTRAAAAEHGAQLDALDHASEAHSSGRPQGHGPGDALDRARDTRPRRPPGPAPSPRMPPEHATAALTKLTKCPEHGCPRQRRPRSSRSLPPAHCDRGPRQNNAIGTVSASLRGPLIPPCYGIDRNRSVFAVNNPIDARRAGSGLGVRDFHSRAKLGLFRGFSEQEGSVV